VRVDVPSPQRRRLGGGGRPPDARSGVKHTWDSYCGALNGLLRPPNGSPRCTDSPRPGVPITLAEGRRDPVPVPGPPHSPPRRRQFGTGPTRTPRT